MPGADDGVPPRPAELRSLYRRVANTLERTAELAEQHAARHASKGDPAAAAIEREHTEQARKAAARARRLASGQD